MPLVLLVLLLMMQPPAPDLRVSIVDAAGQPLSGITVTVDDSASGARLAEAKTDTAGRVRFSSLIASAVRVRVAGALPNGRPLYQPGADAEGIALYLGPPTNQLDLAVEDDGLVRPNPATMLAPDAAGAPVATALPTAVRAPTEAPLPRPALPPIFLVPTGDGSLVAAPPEALEPSLGPIWALLIVGGVALVGVLIGLRHMRRQP